MSKLTLPITDITVLNRQRVDYGDLDELAESLARYGLIQPIVINQDKRLIAGGRRLEAALSLGWTTIDCVYKETLTEDELHELELEENVRRKEMDWKERVMNILTIHRLKKKRAALDGSSWGTRETAEMLGIKGHSNVYYAKLVGEFLEKGDEEIKNADSMKSAYAILMRREEELGQKMLITLEDDIVNRAQETVNGLSSSKLILDDFSTEEADAPVASTVTLSDRDHILSLRERARGIGYLDLNKTEARTLYFSNPLNPPDEFDQYYESRRASCSKIEQDKITIPLSKLLIKGDSIVYMNDPSNKERFDFIATDIPYGIDMDMLNQGNDGHAFQDIGTVLQEHTVEGNEALFRAFFPAAFHCLKPNTYLITWCDAWQFRYMADLATLAGFKVQRWPITWVKTHTCMNQSANVNFTKTTEVALVCRKGTATLSRANIPCHILAGHDELKDKLGHPFVKPYVIWAHLIGAISLEGQLGLEPFCGRGSGFISALMSNRKIIGIELNDAHYNALVENVKDYYKSISPNFIFT